MQQWTLIDKWKNKPQGQVWRVKNTSGDIAYFKFAYPEQWYDAGPIVGNEWLARKLARRLSLPCASVEPAVLEEGKKRLVGIVSLPQVEKGLVSWAELSPDIKSHPELHINRVDLLAGTVAFDAWLTNIDRGSGQNIMLYRTPSARYNWYLIDHGYTLYGCPRKWQDHRPESAHWRKIWQFYHIPRGWQRLTTKRRLMMMVERIQSIPATEIRRMVQSVPDPLYTKAIQHDTIQLLLSRQSRLGPMIDAWLAYPGKKESKW